MITTTKFRRLICYTILGFALVLPCNYALAQDKADIARGKQFMSLIQDFLQVIETTHEVNSDPEKATAFQLHRIQELYKKMGQREKAAEVFRGVLTTSKNQTIRNSAYMMLAELLKQTNKPEQAVEILKQGLQENLEAAK